MPGGRPRGPRIDIVCIICGDIYPAKPSEVARGRKFCRDDCAVASRAPTAESTHERVHGKIVRDDLHWLWTGATNTQGYGHFLLSKNPSVWKSVTHYMWWEKTGRWPQKREVILHTLDCGEDGCVRNDEEGVYPVGDRILPRWGHLALGTKDDNELDKILKKRQARGESISRALTDAEALAIRIAAADGESHATIAERFSISVDVVWQISWWKSWQHVGGPPPPHEQQQERAMTRAERDRAIYDRYQAGGITQKELAAESGMTQAAISQIISRVANRM